jgi:sialate O-acetylesterase
MLRRFFLFGTLVLTSGIVCATIRPADIFTDHAVFQQNTPILIWGMAAPGESVEVTFAGQHQETRADEAGKWMVTLKGMPATDEGRSLIFQNPETSESIEFKDILVGEVWLAGGQSNMQTPMGYYKKTTQADIDSANDPLLRMVTIPENLYEGQNNGKPIWKTTTPQTVSGFSACGYYFAKNLRANLNIPVGIIACSVGGSPAEAWMSRETLETNQELKKILDSYDAGYRKDFPDAEIYNKRYEEFVCAEKEFLQKSRAGEKTGPRPAPPMGPRNFRRPCGLYENMLKPIIPYAVRGAIWYQGENNAQAGFHYRTVFSELIQEWRREFCNTNMPFLFVQLATWGPASDVSAYWPELRESQSWTEEHLENCGMAVLVDGGEEDNIHPHSKEKVGHRLSLLACNMVYGEKEVICRGPRLKEAIRKENSIELTFKDIGSGLVLKPGANNSFEICGDDGLYVSAEIKLMNGKVIVSSENIPEPHFVRYGWKKWFAPTLFNKEGLPASPFRTDNFTPKTAGRYYLDGLR